MQMKKTYLRKMAAVMLMSLTVLFSGHSLITAQTTGVADKRLVGVWILQSMHHPVSGSTMKFGETFSRVKIFGADGEYTCVQVIKTSDGVCKVVPHEYGTYTYKNNAYSEMGRAEASNVITWKDKNTFTYQWNTYIETWKKATNFPTELRAYIVNLCRVTPTPPENMQKLIQKHVFK